MYQLYSVGERAIIANFFLIVSNLMIAGAPTDAEVAAAKELHTLFAEDWEWRMREYPERATLLGDHRYDDKLMDLSAAAVARRKECARQILTKLGAVDPKLLGDQDRLSLELLRREYEVAVAGERFPTEVLMVDQLDGPQLLLGQLVPQLAFRTEQDYRNYLARLEAFPRYLKEVEALLERGTRLRWTQPAGPLRAIPEQINQQLVSDVTASPLYAPFKKLPEDVTGPERQRLQKSARTALQEKVFPALASFRDFVQGNYFPAGRQEIGAYSLPDGKEYYAWSIRRQTTLQMTPQEIHDVGQREVARIRKLMEEVVRQSRFKGTFAEFLTFLRTDPQFYYTRPSDLVTGFRDISKRADAELPRLFFELPRAPYGVKAFPDYEAPSQTAARYYPGAADGSRPGYFMVNTYRLSARPKYEMEALTLHEAVPGHHLQIARAQELKNLPQFRRNGDFTAYIEGWALYAESLGEEMGFYADPYSKFGQLTYEIWRACRLVVDTGMHALGWSRQQAIDFMKENTAKSELEIEVEVDRYIVWPGQALAYKLGELKIKELRQRAETELGADFDIRRFHNALLDDGALPLEILESRMVAWLKAQKAAN